MTCTRADTQQHRNVMAKCNENERRLDLTKQNEVNNYHKWISARSSDGPATCRVTCCVERRRCILDCFVCFFYHLLISRIADSDATYYSAHTQYTAPSPPQHRSPAGVYGRTRSVAAHASLATFKRSLKTHSSGVFINVVFTTFSARVVDIVKCPWSYFFICVTLISTILHCIVHYVTNNSPSPTFAHQTVTVRVRRYSSTELRLGRWHRAIRHASPLGVRAYHSVLNQSINQMKYDFNNGRQSATTG